MSERERFEQFADDNNLPIFFGTKIKDALTEKFLLVWNGAIQAERERCAKIAESMIGANRREIADAILRGGRS